MRFRHFKTGDPIPITIRLSDRRSEDWPTCKVGTCAAISAREAAEEKLRASEQRLLDTQMELAHVTRMTTLGELTASISHEVNQPSPASLPTRRPVCAAEPRNSRPGPSTSLGGWIIDDGNRASEVIRRIRGLAKKSDIEKVPLDLNDVVRETIGLMQRDGIQPPGVVARELAPALRTILGDRSNSTGHHQPGDECN